MTRAKWAMVVMSVTLAAGAGCSWAEMRGYLWVSPEAGAMGEYYVAQSVDEAALMVDVVLQRMYLKATHTPQANGLILDCATVKGSKFRIHISADAEGRTRMRLEWIDAPDRDVQTLVIGGLQATLVPAQKK